MIKKVVTSLLIIFTFFMSNSVFADANKKTVEFYANDVVEFELNEKMILHVVNKDNPTIKINSSDTVLYENSIHDGLIEKVHIQDNYLIIEYRSAGSGSYLNFDVLRIVDNNVEKIFESEDYVKGVLEFDNLQLKVKSPKYKEDDSFAEPSIEVVEIYEIFEEKVTLVDKKEQQFIPEYQAQSKGNFKNPSPAEISKLLTEAALKNRIPPEVLKAIAMAESTWRQFDSNGNPLLGSDGIGLGIMQVSDYRFLEPGPEKDEYVRRLKEDIKFNIDEGVKILLNKWNLSKNKGSKYALPTINDGSMDKIEHWYFAIMAYNGLSKKNDPRHNNATYQDRIYDYMKRFSLLNIKKIPKDSLNITYESGSERMYFTNKLHYRLNGPLTETKHQFKKGQVLPTTTEVNFRNNPDGQIIGKIGKGKPLLITGSRAYSSSNTNHFVWYPVKTSDGKEGYVASSYLDKKIAFLDFSETSPNNRGFHEVALLSGEGIINGFNDGTFRPHDTLTRVQAALMFVRALKLPTPDVSDTGFHDVKVGDDFYREIAAAKKAGLFQGADNKFNRSKKLTRSEMAAVLVRAFNIQGKSDKRFKDVPKGHQFEPAIQALYAKGITKGKNKTEFGFHDDITRVDFSVLLHRTMMEAKNK